MSAADTTTSTSPSLSMVFGSQGRLLTAADLAALPVALPSGPVDYELNNGRLVIMSPPGRRHGSSQARTAGQLLIHGEQPGHGEVFTDVGVVLWRNPDRVVSPDVAFIVRSRLPARESPEGYLETIPDLVVEIRSKNDSPADLELKAEDYLRAGVRLVWIVDCDARTVTVRRAGAETQTLGDGDLLRVEGVIPGMETPVASLFAA
ncbi:MAG: Uma2 family endonuclease [Pirellulales bacterium]